MCVAGLAAGGEEFGDSAAYFSLFWGAGDVDAAAWTHFQKPFIS